MPGPARSPRSRPHGAPAWYLARLASWWITASPPPGAARCWPAATGTDRRAVTMTGLAGRIGITRAPSPGLPAPQRGRGQLTFRP